MADGAGTQRDDQGEPFREHHRGPYPRIAQQPWQSHQAEFHKHKPSEQADDIRPSGHVD